MTRWPLALIVFCALPALATIAPEARATTGELESRYWLEDPLRIQTTFGVPQHLFTLSSGPDSDKLRNLDYAPPQATDLTLAVGYGPFQFSWKQPLPQGNGSKRDYGKHSYDDFRFEWARERVAVSLYYQTFGGFYTDLNGNMGNFSRINSGSGASDNSTTAPSALAASLPQDILKRPDIETRHMGSIAWYAIPLVGENAQAFQLSFASAGDRPAPGFDLDFVSNLFYDQARIRGAVPFVPENRALLFGKGSRLQAVETHSAGLGVGLAASYVLPGALFSFDFAFLYGGGAQRQHAIYSEDHRWKTVYVDNVNFRTGVGFQSGKHQAGLHFWTNAVGSRVDDVRLTSSNMAIELGYGITI